MKKLLARANHVVRRQLKRKHWLLKHFPERIVVGGLLAVGAALRFITITKASIWHDEGFTMMLAGRTPADIWIGSARDVHPPLYYEVLHFWMNLFGRSAFSARALSAAAGIATIYVGYCLVRHLLGRGAATISLIVLSFAPLAVRYSQEARMYGLLSLCLLGGTYALILALEGVKKKTPSNKYWVIYCLLMAAGLYTHYFTIFALASHWIYLMVQGSPRDWKLGKTSWLSRDWWLANIAIFALWLPWLPSFVAQISRGQGISWIPAVTSSTAPGSVWQILTLTDGGQLPAWIFWGVPGLLLAGICYMVWQYRRQTPQVELIFFYSIVPIVLTLILSLFKPIYQIRYLVFAVYGVYILLGLAIWQLVRLNRVAGMATLLALIGILAIGNLNVARQASHSMGRVGEYVNSKYQPGDEMVSAELYTYFDFSYYCQACLDTRNVQTGGDQPQIAIYPDRNTTLRLSTKSGRPNGYGESSLLQDRADTIYIDDLTTLKPSSGRVWVIGKPGDQAYWSTLPDAWKPTLNELTTNSSSVRMYLVP